MCSLGHCKGHTSMRNNNEVSCMLKCVLHNAPNRT
jgi:hypothetical protein